MPVAARFFFLFDKHANVTDIRWPLGWNALRYLPPAVLLNWITSTWARGVARRGSFGAGFYYGKPVPYVGYDGYVECRRHSRKCRRNILKRMAAYISALSVCVRRSSLQIGANTGEEKKMPRVALHICELKHRPGTECYVTFCKVSRSPLIKRHLFEPHDLWATRRLPCIGLCFPSS